MKKIIPILTILVIISCKEMNQSSDVENQKTNDEKLSKIEEEKIQKKQSPLHENLSKEYNYQTFIERIPTDYFDSCVIKIVVSRKDDESIFYQTNITSTYLLGDKNFENENVRSYLTGINANKDVVDNDFGDIVVADYNFDDLEDFAVKREEGGNGGPLYNFYLQSNQNQFTLDEYLSDTMIWFPIKINKKEKYLKTLVRASAVSVCETTFEYNPTKKTWKEKKKQFYEQ